MAGLNNVINLIFTSPNLEIFAQNELLLCKWVIIIYVMGESSGFQKSLRFKMLLSQ